MLSLRREKNKLYKKKKKLWMTSLAGLSQNLWDISEVIIEVWLIRQQ